MPSGKRKKGKVLPVAGVAAAAADFMRREHQSKQKKAKIAVAVAKGKNAQQQRKTITRTAQGGKKTKGL